MTTLSLLGTLRRRVLDYIAGKACERHYHWQSATAEFAKVIRDRAKQEAAK